MTDWGIGEYEHTAAQLQPAAEALMQIAAPVRGETVVDLGCGTGNASLIAARSGAKVTGVDPAKRLRAVAAERAAEYGLKIKFVDGEAASMPLPDASVDLVTSVFGVIFAPDPQAAAAEITRITKPQGRIVFSAWIPEGPMSQLMKATREKFGGDAPEPFAWHDQAELATLFAPHGFKPALEQLEISFTAPSPHSFVEVEMQKHPMWVAGRAAMQNPAQESLIFDIAVGIFSDANEEPMAFKTTSKYVVATLTAI